MVMPDLSRAKARKIICRALGPRSVEPSSAAGKIAIAREARTPQSVGNKRDARRVRPVFLAGEIPAEEWLNFERRQKCRFDKRALQSHRVLLGEVTIRPAGDKGCYRQKRSLPFLPIHVIRTEHELIRLEGRFITKADQLFVMRIGKAPEENAVDHAEDCRGRPNPQ